MVMKRVILVSLALTAALPVLSYGALTKEDLEEIRKIVREEVAVAEGKLNLRIDELDKRLSAQIDELDKRLSSQVESNRWMIGLLVAVIVVVMGLPQVVGVFRERQEAREINELRKRLEQLEGKGG
jgi:hypothetical protein